MSDITTNQYQLINRFSDKYNTTKDPDFIKDLIEVCKQFNHSDKPKRKVFLQPGDIIKEGDMCALDEDMTVWDTTGCAGERYNRSRHTLHYRLEE